MNAPRHPDATYLLGHSAAETRRLMAQARLYNPATRHLLAEAGIAAGMTVLDVGGGAGDVALLLADMVGPRGHVVSIDVNPAILATARERARAAAVTNVDFRDGDVTSVCLDNDFDAAVGRLILLHLRQPVQALRRLALLVRPGGVLAFQEADFTAPIAVADPARYPILAQAARWWQAALRGMGVPLSLGFALRDLFLEAGLPAPQMHAYAPIGGGPDWLGYGWVADALRSILPHLVSLGIASAAEIDIDTLEERMRAEVAGQHGAVMLTPFVGAWTRLGERTPRPERMLAQG